MYGSLLYLPAGLGDCLAPSQTVWEFPAGAQRRFWHRRRLSWSLQQVLRRSWRLSCIVADCLGVSCRCQCGLCTVSDCLGFSCWYLEGDECSV
ncbi:hypothetical protein DPMN_067887 [Dreissena polymorpha]|uniref:Uncharacterized protein n=1 Tax=Dreissena polymorpha TaxID=45954 RepID=A0A9D4BLQ3_DREPO|nr:hypothetical protein DPMN_067887 [Dreissena polymorpha]